VNSDTWSGVIYCHDRQSNHDSSLESSSWSEAADPPLNRGLVLISVALSSLGLWALISAVVSSLIWR